MSAVAWAIAVGALVISFAIWTTPQAGRYVEGRSAPASEYFLLDTATGTYVSCVDAWRAWDKESDPSADLRCAP